jgi:hypothetical protein
LDAKTHDLGGPEHYCRTSCGASTRAIDLARLVEKWQTTRKMAAIA